MRTIILSIILALCSFGAFGQKLPAFSAYPARAESATAKQVNLSSHRQVRMFRTNLKKALAEGVNFAGRFAAATWGCGTSCGETAIIDGRTGNVFFPAELQGTNRGYGEFDERDDMFEYTSVRLNHILQL